MNLKSFIAQSLPTFPVDSVVNCQREIVKTVLLGWYSEIRKFAFINQFLILFLFMFFCGGGGGTGETRRLDATIISATRFYVKLRHFFLGGGVYPMTCHLKKYSIQQSSYSCSVNKIWEKNIDPAG